MTKDTSNLLASDLADKLGVRASTIKYYTELALLPYTSNGPRGHRRYDLKLVKAKLTEIDELRGQNYTLAKIVLKMHKEGKLNGNTDLNTINKVLGSKNG